MEYTSFNKNSFKSLKNIQNYIKIKFTEILKFEFQNSKNSEKFTLSILQWYNCISKCEINW